MTSPYTSLNAENNEPVLFRTTNIY